ncbi:cation:proton antiporter, partial [Chloroflexota bacterium]
MDELIVTLLIVFTGIMLIPWIARRIHLPVIVTEIIFGIIVGKSLLNLIPENTIINFFSAFGLAYLMFLGGIETDFGKMSGRILKQAATVVSASVIVPFVAGFLLADMVKVNPSLLGTIFCTTSLGLTLPMLKGNRYRPQFARLLLASVVLVDIISIFLLAFILTGVQGSINISFFYSLA